jgi:prephenate dehydrogenase
MADKQLKHVTVVGVGLLGGSAAMALKAFDPEIRIAGVGRRRASLDLALEAGAIDSAHLDPLEAIAATDLIILATPVGAFAKHLETIKPALRRGTIVTDVGSTKASVVRTAERVLGRGGPFVGSHPMAGSEQKGVAFARADLFAGATCILTPTSHSPSRIVRRLERFWATLGMRTVQMTPAAHDRALARVSHLPHALAGLLMMLPGKADLDVSATGFRDATRLAGGDPEMWRDIFLTNRRAVLDAIDRLDEKLCQFRDLVDLGDAKGLESFLSQAKRRRDRMIASRPQERRIAAE